MAALWLLDTCVLSETVKPQPDAKVMRWLAGHEGEGSISVVSVAELSFGVLRLAAGRRRHQLQAWLNELRTGFGDSVLPTDEAVWLAFARLKASLLQVGKPQDDLDLLIAATAQVHGLSLVTRNSKDFLDTGVALVNPWR